MQLLGKILGDPNKKELKTIQPLIDTIAAFEPDLKKLSDEELAAKTEVFRSQLVLYQKGGMVLENELCKLFREVLEKVEPLAAQCSDEQLHQVVNGPRQKIDRNDPESTLKDHLQDALSEFFEKSYENLSSLLNQLRSAAAVSLAETRQQWPDRASDPKQAIIDLLSEVEPALKDVDDDELSDVFDEAWTPFEALRSSTESRGMKYNNLLRSSLPKFSVNFSQRLWRLKRMK